MQISIISKYLKNRKPIIGLLSTGNELQSPHEAILEKGKIRDSNKTTLQSLFTQEHFETLDIGIAKDTYVAKSKSFAKYDVDVQFNSFSFNICRPDAVYQKLVEGLNKTDVLVCTGKL